jgi:SET domain-containing protein
MKHVDVAPARNGLGLFASKAFKPGQTILQIAGRVVHHRVLWKRRGSTFSANCIRYGPQTYLDPGEHLGRYLNHSCEPNAAIGKLSNRIFVYAAEPIDRGDEIVFDYSTTIGDDDIWTMRCNCGEPGCRGRIKRFGSLPRALKERYLGDGLVPKYIIATLD